MEIARRNVKTYGNKSEVINLLETTNYSQKAIAEIVECSQSFVSAVNREYDCRPYKKKGTREYREE